MDTFILVALLCLPALILAEDGQTEAFSAFQQNALNQHNFYRAVHGCPPLRLDRGLNTMAQRWADHLARTKDFKHSRTPGVGENLFSVGSTSPIVNGDGATAAWYSEIKNYDFNNPGFKKGTGHFTQVVWKSSSSLGIGEASYINDKGWFVVVVVANYRPPGNVIGAFRENVPMPL